MKTKKLILLALGLLFCATQGFAVDWSSISYLGSDAGTEYANKYKISVPTGVNVVNIQKPGFATAVGIYMTFPDATYTSQDITIAGVKASYDVQGAGIVLHLSNFIAQETTVVAKDKTFYVYYVNGTSKTPSDLAVNESSYEIQKNQTVTISKNEGTLYYTTSSTGAVSFASSNSSVATVDPSIGVVNAVSTGLATITVSQAEDATYQSGSKQITITVVKDPSEIEWSGWINQGAEGPRAQYKDQFKYELNVGATVSGMEDHNSVPVLYVYFNAAILSSSPSFEFNGAGMWMPLSTFTKQITTVSVTLTNSTVVTFRIYNAKAVQEVKLTSITLNNSSLDLFVGGSSPLSVSSYLPADATNPTVSWSSSDEEVATVSENGLVEAKKEGNATITATAKDGSGVTATCAVTVNAAPAAPVYAGEVETDDHSLHIAYTIKYNANGTLTFNMRATTDKSLAQSTIYHITSGSGDLPLGQFTFDGNKEATLTTSSTFTKDDEMNLKFYIVVPGSAIQLPFSYTVGADNTSCGTCFQVAF